LNRRKYMADKQMNIRIEQDECPESPRNWDNLGTMVMFHKRYDLGDKDHGYRSEDYNGWDELEKAIRKEKDASVCIPIFGYDHGGLTINTSGFSCPWDSGQLGFVFVSDEKLKKEFGRKRITDALLDRAREILRNEVETYDQYLTGDVWGYIIEDEDGEHIDSCWGFFGHDYCQKEAEEMLAFLEEQEKERAAELRRVQAAMPCCQP
jgi:hypothetical protein